MEVEGAYEGGGRGVVVTWLIKVARRKVVVLISDKIKDYRDDLHHISRLV